LFDLLVGTSTGGILALGLSKPGTHGVPAFAAAELIDFYTHEGQTIDGYESARSRRGAFGTFSRQP
jgi:patatin-like phospholipase/acyl hydrolase